MIIPLQQSLVPYGSDQHQSIRGGTSYPDLQSQDRQLMTRDQRSVEQYTARTNTGRLEPDPEEAIYNAGRTINPIPDTLGLLINIFA
ncbi:MAG: hypothetical protein K9L30_02110 [Desulfobacterales bacterium]|nr:hypothetical protein [Desulfobacterales bacterium]